LCGVLVTVGGVAGTSRDQRILDAAAVTPFAPPRLTEPSVTRALRSLGVSGLSGKDAELTYPALITRPRVAGRHGPPARGDSGLCGGKARGVGERSA
jgi:hypothetical protein